MGSFSIWHWLVVLLIVVLVFGTKRLKNVGKDLGEAVKGFKDGVSADDKPKAQLSKDDADTSQARDASSEGASSGRTQSEDERNPR